MFQFVPATPVLIRKGRHFLLLDKQMKQSGNRGTIAGISGEQQNICKIYGILLKHFGEKANPVQNLKQTEEQTHPMKDICYFCKVVNQVINELRSPSHVVSKLGFSYIRQCSLQPAYLITLFSCLH